jgi:RNA polymerase sigma factor (sigma-70 family)
MTSLDMVESSELTHEQQMDMFNYLMPLVSQLAKQAERKFYSIQKDELLTTFMEGAWQAALKYDATKSPNFWGYARYQMKFFVVDEDRRLRGRSVSRGERKGHLVMDLHELEETNLCEYTEQGYDEVETTILLEQALSKCSPMTVEILTRLDVLGEPHKILASELGVTISRISQLRAQALREAIEVNSSIEVQKKKHGAAKLSIEQVEEIRKSLETGKSQKELAKEFGVSQSTVSQIKNSKTLGKRKLRPKSGVAKRKVNQ